MNSWTSILQSGSNRLWPATALTLIALTIGIVGRMNGLESWVYDYFQRNQYKAASDEILLLTVDSSTEIQKYFWEDDGFRQITRTLSKHGARLIVATHPLSLPEVPNGKQIRALTKLQSLASRTSTSGSELDLPEQLDELRERYEHREGLITQLQTSNNVVLASYSVNFAAENSSSEKCKAHSIDTHNVEADALETIRQVRYLSTPPQRVCNLAAAIGFSDFWPDNDGVVRSTDLLVNVDGVYLPSLALATFAALSSRDKNIVVASPGTLTVDQQITHTGSGFKVLNRYYNGTLDQSAFRTATVSSILSGHTNPNIVRNRIVLIGESATAAMPGISTPINLHMSPLEVVASSLSNILEQDYLLRPNWLPLLETGLLLAILVVVLFWIPIMPPIGSALMGIVLAMLVISIEAWFLVSKGIWVQFASAAVFSAAAVWAMHFWNMATLQQMRKARHQPRTAILRKVTKPPKADKTREVSKPIKVSAQSELDLKFSVLRQQPPTDQTKQQMYEIALIHDRAKEYARAESVLAHIDRIDENYKDVSQLLDKLSGTRKKKAAHKKTGAVALLGDRRKLGRYEIKRVLGRGAMATVYLGLDPKINRKVAIKTIALAKEFDKAELNDARLQFRREAESAGRLNHPNIIAIYDAGEDDDVSYLAMEYFEGASLLQHTQADDLITPKWVLELCARAAEALDYAHRQNVVHRDVKPANLMYHAATDTLKLTDFGIARLTDNNRTKTGIILGTPSYMSPEQLSASGVTGQSDLYSLGVTMYQLLTGTAPFRADSIPKLMDKIVNEKHRSVTELRSDLPACIDAILDKSMAKDPNDRYPNGREMAIQLRKCAKNFK